MVRTGAGNTSGQARGTALLYSDPVAVDSHRIRLFLAEKHVAVHVVDALAGLPDEALSSVNPLGTLPTIVDRDLVLYDVRVIVDYLEERHPHPPMMPVDPPARARTRLALYRIEHDWHRLLGRRVGTADRALRAPDPDQDLVALVQSLASSAELFAAMPYFLSAEYSILDAMLCPLLWRLERYGIVLADTAAPVADYARRMFARPEFDASLSAEQRRMSHQ